MDNPLGDLMPLVNIGGPILLGLALAWAMTRNMGRDKSKDYVTEKATRELYEDPPR